MTKSTLQTTSGFFIFLITVLATCFHPRSALAIDVADVISELKSNGALIEIHGIDKTADRYVGTYRSSSDFFDYRHFALTTKDAAIQKTLAGLRRHDVVRVQGDIPSPKRPFLHIEIKALTLVKSPGEDIGENPHSVKVPDDLIGKTEMTVKIHAMDPDGRMLVVDYQGSVFPVVVPKARRLVAADLDRGDLITMKFEINEDPDRPVHLSVADVPDAIVVLEHMSALHGTPVTYEGHLVLFPKSPQVLFNVFALQLDLPQKNKREYTILNFDPAAFMKLRDKMQLAWDRSKIPAVNDRNKLVKRGLMIKAKGVFNYVDKAQANPQILIDQIDDISFSEKWP